jgi:hypothetical protein
MTEQLTAPTPAPTPGAPWNVLAIVSLITSLVGFSLAGIITGHLSLGQLKTSGEQGRGLALAGVIIGYSVLGLVVVACIFFFLAAIFIPLFFVGMGDYSGYRR